MALDIILEVSATMIIGILFIATITEVLKIEEWAIGRWLFIFCISGIIPFTITAILALLEQAEASKLSCIISFVLFCVTFSVLSAAIAFGSKPPK